MNDRMDAVVTPIISPGWQDATLGLIVKKNRRQDVGGNFYISSPQGRIVRPWANEFDPFGVIDRIHAVKMSGTVSLVIRDASHSYSYNTDCKKPPGCSSSLSSSSVAARLHQRIFAISPT